jgi:hypothetical protein
MKSLVLFVVAAMSMVVAGTGPWVPSAAAQGKQSAVLLLPESDMDLELADDLTEVLISALIERGGKDLRIIGKEGFKKTLKEKLSDDGTACYTDIECVREEGKRQDLALLVFGRVGKAMGGYRLEVWKLSLTSAPDRPQYRKHVPGDLAKLIEEVELVANWVLTPDNPYLTISLNVDGAQVFVDGKPVDYTGKPIAVAPGTRTVEARKQGYSDGKATVNCEHEQSCRVTLELKVIKETKPVKPPVKPVEGPKVEEERSSLMPWVYVLAGVAVATAGGGIYMYTDMLAVEDDITALKDDLCPDQQCWKTGTTPRQLEDAVNAKIDEGQTSAMWATVLGVTAGVTGAAAATLLVVELVSGPTSSATAVVPQVSPEFSGFVLETTF